MDKCSSSRTSGALCDRQLSLPASPTPSRSPRNRAPLAGNLTYHTTNLFEPSTIAELQQLVRDHPNSAPSAPATPSTPSRQHPGPTISLHSLNQITLDEKSRTVTVGAGVRYGDLAPSDAKASLSTTSRAPPHLRRRSHRHREPTASGIHNQNLSSSVAAIEFVAADGEGPHPLPRPTTATPSSEPSYHTRLHRRRHQRHPRRRAPPTMVAQTVYLDLPFSELEHHFDDIFGAGYSVSLFTDWQKPSRQPNSGLSARPARPDARHPRPLLQRQARHP